MTIRRLNGDEFYRLGQVADGFVPNADAAIVVVAEDEGEIVGRMCLLFVGHVEGTWIKESHRRGLIGARLMEELERAVRSEGITKLMAYSTSGEHDAFMHRLGFVREPWTVWSKSLCQ